MKGIRYKLLIFLHISSTLYKHKELEGVAWRKKKFMINYGKRCLTHLFSLYTGLCNVANAYYLDIGTVVYVCEHNWFKNNLVHIVLV